MVKPQILLLTHGGWGMSLVNGVKMILGTVDFVHEIPLMPEVTLPEYMAVVDEYVSTMPENSLVFTDFFGGTTTNVAAKVSKDKNLKVISGLNAPLLLEACSQIMFTESLVFDNVLAAGQASIIDVIGKVMESMKRKEG